MPYLVLLRHGQTTWNKLGKWTGVTDVDLTSVGRAQARAAGATVSGITFHHAYISELHRTADTLTEAMSVLDQTVPPVTKAAALNERDYGKLEGKNKWQVRELYGADRWHKVRRGWNEPIPDGETLKDVYMRVVPYFESTIMPQLKAGQSVIVSSHGNVMRALIKYLERISDNDIEDVEVGTGSAYVYAIEPGTGVMITREIRADGSDAP